MVYHGEIFTGLDDENTDRIYPVTLRCFSELFDVDDGTAIIPAENPEFTESDTRSEV